MAKTKSCSINEELYNSRIDVLKKIEENERLGGDAFFNDVEIDPPYKTIMPEDVDYEYKKFSSKFHRFFATILAKIYAKKVVKDFEITVVGEENIKNVNSGAVITSNHFSIYENVAVWEAVKKSKNNRDFYKIIREGNYAMTGPLGYLLKHQRTLPLSSNMHTMMNLARAVEKHLKEGNFVLVYPEQAMWWNYRKPRPYKIGAYHYAVKADVPVIPCFVTMKDKDALDEYGFKSQIYTIHVMPPIYANKDLPLKDRAKDILDRNFALCKAKYEEVYGEKLTYLCDE